MMAARDDILTVAGLVKTFPVRRGLFIAGLGGAVRAVDGIDFSVGRGQTLGLVGESGCGKSTTGRLVLRLIDPTAGRVTFDGVDLTALGPGELRQRRRDMQIIFQDPFGALNPRMTVEDIIGEPLAVYGVRGADRLKRVVRLLDIVGLAREYIDRYPHEFSGGQRQRIGIARALALEPKFIVCDEAVSALDVSIQAQIINLLQDLQRSLGLSYLFISHNLAVVRHISDRVAVMYLGKIVEIAERDALYGDPRHPYTKALLAAVPVPRPGTTRTRMPLGGDMPSPLDPPRGCRFHTRCALAQDRCRIDEPKLVEGAGGHQVACHLVPGG